jgi:AcrR family transcriptional regulator
VTRASTRADAQIINRQKLLHAAREEFIAKGFDAVKLEEVAARANLTRGAVYSNFANKRALYFEVLVDVARQAPGPRPTAIGDTTLVGAVNTLAKAWLGHLDDVDASSPAVLLGNDLLARIGGHEETRRSVTRLMDLQGVLLGHSLEVLEPAAPEGTRRVRLAGLLMLNLMSASFVMSGAVTSVNKSDLVAACGSYVELEIKDRWMMPSTDARVCAADIPWQPPLAMDAVWDSPVDLRADGTVVFLGLDRLPAIDDVVRIVGAGAQVTLVPCFSGPPEMHLVAQLALHGFGLYLRQAVPEWARPRLRVVVDERGAMAGAAGLDDACDDTELALRICDGRVRAVAQGLGAGVAIASDSLGVPAKRQRRPTRG